MKIACVGDNCIDIYLNTGSWYCGGNPVNVGIYTIRLGDDASYIGAVGTDKYGQYMLESLCAHNMDVSHVKVLPGKTAQSLINLVGGERVFCGYEEGVLAEFKLNNEDLEFISKHDIVISGRWGKIEKRLKELKTLNVPVAFDFATKIGDELFESVIGYVDYVFYSGNEDNTQTRDDLRLMCERGAKIAVCTLGAKGSLAFDGKQFTQYGVIPCDVKDTMGAGDSYIAGFLHGVLRQLPLLECMRFGAESSSVTLQYVGAW